MSGAIEEFGRMPDGRRVERVTLRGAGLSAQVLTHGARVQDLRLEGVAHPLVLGSDRLDPYLGEMLNFGSIVGRFANRIGGAGFAIDGQPHHLDRNFRGRHTLHGGSDGTAAHLWRIEDLAEASVRLACALDDGHMGFPGNLRVTAEIALRDPCALQIDIAATADAATPCSFAHHGYFALDGGGGDVTRDQLWIAAEHYLPVDADLIPDGPPRAVAGTPFDFRTPREIGTHGYDHNFCLSATAVPLRPVARLESVATGLTLTVETDQPGLQVYDAAHLAGLEGLGGRRYGPKSGLALETQNWPDAPNRPDFPPCLLRPGEIYRHRVRYAFA